ncbi:MAG: GGDEF domain-containing protein [Pseudomonas sp.]|uniref:GGDEF domain-containing protein n=1 Tax=Pseudomonas sp. TaxID=306 RepID=UPI003D0FBD2D
MLDPRSIVFILAALSLLMAIVLSAMPSTVRDRQQGARHWSVSMLCVAVASVLYGLRDIVPESLSMVVANAAAMGATTLIYSGGRAFFGLPRHGRLLIAVLVVANLGLLYSFYVQDLYAIRVVIFSTVSGVLLFLFGRDVLRHRPRDAGRAQFPYLFTSITVIFDALVSLARIVNAVLVPSGGGDFLAPTPINALYFSTHGLLAICISVGFILMLNERLHAMLEHQLSHDPLTNAYSRPMIFELAQRELERSEQPVSLLLLDIDHFKQVNDSLGHQGGDAVLKHFVNTLTNNLRHDEPLGRYGGEEFVILLRNADARDAHYTAERLRQAIADAPYQHAQGEYPLTASIGCATTHEHQSLEQLLQRADTALYRAKREGRNRVEYA